MVPERLSVHERRRDRAPRGDKTMRANGKQRVYRPRRTFDDDLVDLARFFADNELSLGGFDGMRLGSVGAEQRDERAEDAGLLLAYKAHHEAFVRNQAARHSAYMRALSYARATFRDDSAKLAEMLRFRRHVGRNAHSRRDGMKPTAPEATQRPPRRN
jgi:hypothetical protein